MALKPLVMTTEQYSIEANYDFVTVKGRQYKTAGPNQVNMQTGDRWTWKSDDTNTREGFKICGSGLFVSK